MKGLVDQRVASLLSVVNKQEKLLFKHVARKIFLEDWALKLTALVITLALWLGVTGLSTPTTKRLTVPLLPSISNAAEITNTLIPEVDVVISGDKRRLDQINKNDLVASLDLTDVPPGERVISLSPENVFVALPQGIKLVEVQPGRIPVNLEAVEEKDVEVRVQTSGEPAEGFEVYSSSALPPRIRVRGPVSFVRPLQHVESAPVDITGRDEDLTARQVGVSVLNPKAAVLNTVVDVFVRIGEKRVERSFSIPVTGGSGKTAVFTLYGPRTVLAKVRADSLKVEAPADGLGGSPAVILPADVENLVEVRRLAIK